MCAVPYTVWDIANAKQKQLFKSSSIMWGYWDNVETTLFPSYSTHGTV